MAMSNEKQLDDRHRLLEMREYLNVRSQPEEEDFSAEVIAASTKKVQPIIDAYRGCPGEEIIAAIAKDIGVHFEEVRNAEDIEQLKQKYLVRQKELGFGLLAKELADPSVDALLFQRMHAAGEAPDRWIAVLNLQQTAARAYWSRPHELLHRLAEPPQRRLAFFRHRTDLADRLERIIDLGAAELAFPKVAFGSRVQSAYQADLDWNLVRHVGNQFAPTASLLSTAKAFVRYWPYPVFFLKAEMRGRNGKPHEDTALRISIEDFNTKAASSGIHFFKNMRVPPSSAMFHAYQTEGAITEFENLRGWVTSNGKSLPNRRALTSGLRVGSTVYGLISPM